MDDAAKVMTEQERNEVKMNSIMKFIVDVRHQLAVILGRIVSPAIGALLIVWAAPKDASAVAWAAFFVFLLASEISGVTDSINGLAKEMKAIREQRNETPND